MNSIISGIFILIGLLSLTYLAWRLMREKEFNKGLLVILFIGLFLRIFSATDPYLHSWDERYHALVAKNMIVHPLKPTLHEHPLLEYDNQNWVGSNIWIAKPILPLLLMSGGIAVFGANLFAVRFVYVLLGMLAIWLTFLIAKRLFNEKVAYLAAFLHAIQGSMLELSGGRISSDHAELCFIVMVELGIYFALSRFNRIGKDFSIFLAGVFMGLAFLSKWYPGLIVLPIWALFFYFYYGFNVRIFLKQFLILLLGFAITSIPWCVYMLVHYPTEMIKILQGAASAYTTAVASHDKPFYYYLIETLYLFGELVFVPLIYFIYCGVTKKANFNFWPLIAWVAIPIILFSFGDTKRFTYLLIAAPAFFIMIAKFWTVLSEGQINFIPKWGRLILLILLIGLPFRYGVERAKIFGIKPTASVFYSYSSEDLAILTSKTIVFGSDDYIEIMFHTDVYAAYRERPSEADLRQFIEDGYSIVLAEGNHLVPFNP